MSESSGLCVSCGLCCDGTLFERAKTSPEEADRPRSFGLTVFADDSFFALPCPLLDGTVCTIYDERFRICRTFRCKFLRNVDAGAVTRDRADSLVAEAKRLRAKAEAYDPAVGNITARRARLTQLADWAGRVDPADRRNAAETYLALAVLERFVDANFKSPKVAAP